MKIYFIISLLPLYIYLFLKFKKVFHMMQQNWYNEGNRYLKWIQRNIKAVAFPYELSFILILFVSGYMSKICMVVLSFIYFSFMIIIHIKNAKNDQVKKPIVFTKRVIRLYVTMYILYTIPLIVIYKTFNDTFIFNYYFIMWGLAYFSYFSGYLCNIINKPIEKCVYYSFYFKAKKKLKQRTNMEIIGITGSYGKTSSKNILADILSIKYDTFRTPKNFNTAYGLINSVNNYLDNFCEYFVAEIGAVKRGDINKICKIIHPKYAILTIIGTAHLESYGSRENIKLTKFELIESLPKDGLAILNGDDKEQLSYDIKNTVETLWIGIDNTNVDVYASDIKLSHKGTTFNITFKGDSKKYKFETILLGKANVYNILAAVLLGKSLGMTIEVLQRGVKSVKPITHRLELKNNGSVHIIDDAYNSNPVGSKMAVEVLGLMPGKKIIVTPGMIELGIEQYESNRKFGTYIADNADEVILIGEKQTKPIYDGLIEKNFDKEKIHILNDVKLAFSLIEKLKDKETYVLLENDLPDIFNE